MENVNFNNLSDAVPLGIVSAHGLSHLSSSSAGNIQALMGTLNGWSLFQKGWEASLGYPAENFRFVPGQTPMSSFRESVSLILTYYLIIFGGREVMRDRKAFKLHVPFIIHNVCLTAISGGLLALFVKQIGPSVLHHGLFANICSHKGWTPKLVVLYYLNYLTKYLELLDTVFLVLKKKPLTFLHTYHHGATALLCYTQLAGETSISWVPITLNLMVHVVMYWYYAQAARGVRIWWKKYITTMQIVQFVLDLGFIYFATYTYVAHTYAPSLPHIGSCGDPKQELAAFTGCAILTSYLILFVMFYFSTYKPMQGTQRVIQKASKVEVAPTSANETAANIVHSAADIVAMNFLEDIHRCKSTFQT